MKPNSLNRTEIMNMNFAIRHNRPFPGWLWRYLTIAAMLICIANPGVHAAAINIRGMEYGDISLKELVSIYQQAYTKAGFTMTAQAAKDDGQKMKLKMHFLSKDKTKKDKATLVLALYPLNGTPSPTCMPCTVSAETIDITLYETGSESVDLEQQMQQARDKADEEIANTLKKHIWYDPVDGVPQYGKLYDKIGVLDFVSIVKEAYTSAGFMFSQEDSTTKLTEDKNREYRQLIYLSLIHI